MPKKFQGENSKATEARAREAEKKRTAQEQKTKSVEDAKWADDDKSLARKQQRQTEIEAKQQEKLDKKREAQNLLAEEEASLKGKSAKSVKVTRSQIEKVAASEAPKAATPKEVPLPELNENINRLLDDGEGARNVEEAIKVLSVNDSQVDRHPERRAAAAFKTFEEIRLPQLKAENSNMRLSQLKQVLKKEWLKSPQNPYNQRLQ